MRRIGTILDSLWVVCAVEGVMWLKGHNTLTNVEALAAMLFLGWFIVFSRQIASIEADRIQQQLLLRQTVSLDELDANEVLDDAAETEFQTVLDEDPGIVGNDSKGVPAQRS